MYRSWLMDSPLLFYAKFQMLISGTLPLRYVTSHKLAYIIYRYLALASSSIFLVFLYVASFGSHQNGASLENRIQTFNVMCMCTVTYIKTHICLSKNMESLIITLIDCEEELRNNEKRKIRKVYQDTVNKSKLIQISYITFDVSCLIMLMLPYFVHYSGVVKMQKEVAVPVPFAMWLPFDKNKHYLVTLLIYVCYCIVGANYFCSFQIIVLSLCLNLTLRLKVLGIMLKNINSNSESDLGPVEEQLKNYAKEHTDIISNVALLNNTLEYSMLLDFITMSVQLSVSLFLAILAEDANLKLFSLSFSLQVLIQLLILYWYASEIEQEGVAIADAIYEIHWYNFDKSNKSNLQIMLWRSQQPLLLRIGPFGYVTLETAVKIIKGAYTYVTILQQAYNRTYE